MLKKIDIYIIKKFLGTYFLAILLIIGIAVVFDLSEKLDNFLQNDAPVKAIIFDYYLNFIPYFANLFSPLFTFISVIYFTSKLAYDTEIIAILAGGVSFKRLVRPYMISAGFIALMTFLLSSYVIPPANMKRLIFEDNYYKQRKKEDTQNIHVEIEPGLFISINRFSFRSKIARNIYLERFDGKKLVSRLEATSGKFDEETGKWKFNDYEIRNFEPWKEDVVMGKEIDTTLDLTLQDFYTYDRYYETLTNNELEKYIKKQTDRGVGNVEEFVIEKYNRFANSFSAFILTLIGVSISSRKVKGGTGLHMGLGLLLSFSYILFSTVSTTFAINGEMNMLLAVWLPNIIYIFIAAFLYKYAPK
ncbi:LptF/LptG family permease [Saccharicrinis sp. FJH54]|uniref:LptF/LptG family permease n=1 Tax=Saccharicrinis sp. FJH54 TaxID=3344665 RepID=UPI0035D433E8